MPQATLEEGFQTSGAGAMVVAEAETTATIVAVASLKHAATPTAVELKAAAVESARAADNLAAAGLVDAAYGARLL